MSMRNLTIMILAVFIISSTSVILADTADADRANVITFYRVDDKHLIKSVQAWDYNGYVIEAELLPELPEGYDYYVCSMPEPGGWCNPDYYRWDPNTPMTSPSSIYIWSVEEMEKNYDPIPAPSTEPTQKSTDVTGMVIFVVVIGAFAIGVIVWAIKK